MTRRVKGLERLMSSWLGSLGRAAILEPVAEFSGPEAWHGAHQFTRERGIKTVVRVNGRLHMLYTKGQRLCCESMPAHFYDGDRCECWEGGS